MLQFFCSRTQITLRFNGRQLMTVPLTLDQIYQLEAIFAGFRDNDRIDYGVELVFTEPRTPECAPLWRELLLELLALCTIYLVYPKISDKTPLRAATSREDFEHHLHSIRNAPLFAVSCHCQILAGYAANRPAVIVAPGPSIDFEALRRFREFGLVLAVGRVLPRLLARDIVPDILYIQETTASGWRTIFGPDDGKVLDTALVYNPMGPLFEYAHRVRQIYKSWNLHDFEPDQFPKIEETAPSSTSGAYSLTKVLGANPIFFMGCDCGEARSDEAPPAAGCLDLDALLDQGTVPAQRFASLGRFSLRGENGPILTQSDYLVCAQWLKARILADRAQYDRLYFDFSATGMLRDTGCVEPWPAFLEGPDFTRPTLPRYPTKAPMGRHLKYLAGRYAFLDRHLDRQRDIPPSFLAQPFNCVFKDVDAFAEPGLRLDDTQLALVRIRLAALRDACATALGALGDA